MEGKYVKQSQVKDVKITEMVKKFNKSLLKNERL